MPALRPAAACLVSACALVLSTTSSPASASPSPMVDKINRVRAAHGMTALRYSRSLARSSSRYSRHVLRTDRFAHASRIMASRRFSSLGEVLALSAGWKIRRRRTLRLWLGSPGHRTVLLSSSYRYIGAARVRGRFGGSRAMVWTVQLGR
jgi:uncharacterized protein YkwD